MYFSGTPLEKTCDQFVPCPPSPSRYQTQDGRCNHPDPAKATWGAAGSPMERLLPPSYQDGVWEPRSLSVDGTPLTNPRTISRFLLSDADRPHPVINLLFMQFGQFMSHDVTQSASITTSKYHFFPVDSVFMFFFHSISILIVTIIRRWTLCHLLHRRRITGIATRIPALFLFAHYGRATR